MKSSYNKTSSVTSIGWGGFISATWGRKNYCKDARMPRFFAALRKREDLKAAQVAHVFVARAQIFKLPVVQNIIAFADFLLSE
jgi:hypothetical protein